MSAFRPRAPAALLLLALALLLAGTGCGREGAALVSEPDEPLYRDGQQKKREGQTQAALADFLRVIVKRSDQAPESHLEVALIQQEYDPIAAIYHFNKYIELEPNSRQVPNVRDLINTAKRNFARTLPLATPAMDAAAGQSDLLDQINKLQRKNDELEARLVSMRGDVSPFLGGAHPDAASAPAPLAVAAPLPVPDDAAPAVAPVAPPPPVPEPVAAAPVAPRPRPSAAAPSARAEHGRTYTVQAHDSLYGIVKKVYGSATAARVQAVRDANRNVLTSAGNLKPGMVLKMP
jgi:hypothetical protein